MVIGDLGGVFVCVLCRVWFADAVERAHVCVPPASAAGIRNASWKGFLVGLTKSFLYGAYAGLVYVPIYNFLQRRWAGQQR